MNGLSELVAGHEGARDKIKGAFSDVVDKVSTAIPLMIDGFTDFVSAIAESAPDMIDALVKGIGDNLPKLLQSATDILEKIVGYLIENADDLLDGGLEIVKSLAKYISENASKIFKGLIDLCSSVLEWFLNEDNLTALFEAGGEMVKAIGKGIWDNRGELLKALWGAIKAAVKGLFTGEGELAEAAGYTMSLARGGPWGAVEHYVVEQAKEGFASHASEYVASADSVGSSISRASALLNGTYEQNLAMPYATPNVTLELDGFELAHGQMRYIDDAAAYNVNTH